MCGEKTVKNQNGSNETGSPPHVRGKVYGRLDIFSVVRITPACAGKSLRYGRGEFAAQDHPRMRGEKPLLKAATLV